MSTRDKTRRKGGKGGVAPSAPTPSRVVPFVPRLVPGCAGQLLAPELKDWLAGFIARMPIEDFNEFQRGYLGGLMTVYEAAGFDLNDARYLAGVRTAKRMGAVA